MKKREKNSAEGAQNNRKRTWFGRHRKLTIVLIVVLVIALVVIRGCAAAGKIGVIVTTTNAFRGELQESISTGGTVEGEHTKVYFAPVAGTLEEITVAPGDAVKAGDILIAYDADALEKSYRQASLEQDKATASYEGAIADNSKSQSKLSEANHNLAILDQQIEDHKAYLKDLKSKLSQSQRETSNALSKESYELNRKLNDLDKDDADYDSKLKKIEKDIARNNYLQAIANSSDYVAEMEEEIERVQEFIADRESYKAQMESQKSSSEASVLDSYDKVRYEADKELSGMTYEEAQSAYNEVKDGIRAEFDGIVTAVNVVEGADVAPGTQLLTLESSSEVRVSFSASKQDVEKLQIGQSAEVTISGNVYTGKVSKINRMAERNAANTPLVGAQIRLDAPDDRIILGMDAKFTIYTKKEEDALLVPVEVINADRDGDFVYVVEDGKAVMKRVVCGISNDTYAVILEGITEDDTVIQTYVGSLEEGAAVTVTPQM
ncbi:MAG: efflux RND transporter periplasmic adaptor subunit [Lachnospiraceae bacterium]|nr:efflux RND transporter periplasmic adaptor subunit [Lachnospiraceae bacterium]